jgi:hypothetical protein
MKVLLDACVPRPLRKFLPDHTVQTAQEMGWGQLKNGALLQAVEPEFDAFLTSDQNLKYQQKVSGRKLFVDERVKDYSKSVIRDIRNQMSPVVAAYLQMDIRAVQVWQIRNALHSNRKK